MSEIGAKKRGQKSNVVLATGGGDFRLLCPSYSAMLTALYVRPAARWLTLRIAFLIIKTPHRTGVDADRWGPSSTRPSQTPIDRKGGQREG